MVDHYRLHAELLLAGLFVALLVLFAGRTGVRALLSVALTVLAVWKVLVPCYLRGANSVWVGLGVTLFLTVLIIRLCTDLTGARRRRSQAQHLACLSPA